MAITISEIFVYPVKSCRGISLPASAVGLRGLAHDRTFLIVDDAHRFLTQRALPRMALIETAMEDKALIFRAPGAPGELRVALPAGGSAASEPPPSAPAACAVTIWRDTVAADDAGPEAAAWLSAVLERPCRLVRAGPAYARPVPRERVPLEHRAALPAPEVSFADGFPVLVVSEASLRDLNDRLDEPLPMNRFRPNLVLSGCAPYAEDTWAIFNAGGITFRHAGPCVRCAVPTINQHTGKHEGKEPLRTLALYRSGPDGTGVIFGQNAFAETGGRVRVGDPVSVEATVG